MNQNKIIDLDIINDLALKIHVQNVLAGWWPDHSNLLTKVQLVLTEIAEATEGVRKDLMDDHLTHRKMEEVELADTLIRVLDIGGFCGFDYVGSTTFEDVENEVIANLDHPAALHFIISAHATAFGCIFTTTVGVEESLERHNDLYSRLIDIILIISNIRQFDIITATEEKLEYNKHRNDHKLAVRQAEGGKKF